MTDIETLIQKVKHKRVDELDSETLLQLQEKETLAALLKILHDNDYFVRSDASWALQLVGKPAIPGLLEALKDESWNVRDAAAETLGLIGNLSAVPALIEAMLDQEKSAFSSAVYALEMIAMDHEDVADLYPLLSYDDPYARLGAAYALKEKAGEEGIQGFIDLVRYGISGDKHEFEKAAECLSKIGQPAIPALVETLQDENEVLRRLAAQVLSTIGDPSALPAMIAAMNDESIDVRQDVVTGLGGFGQSALPILLETIVGDDDNNSWNAYSALRWIGAPASKELFALLDQNDEKKRKSVASTLGFIQIDTKDETLLNRLLNALDDENPNMQKGAAETLTTIRTPEALAAVDEWRRRQT